jgi:hypothetical protein
MKGSVLLTALMCIHSMYGISQSRYLTRDGHIWFFSSAPLENIEAHNRKVNSALDLSTGELVFSLRMDDFTFRKSLMQEHFNENYAESHTYPNATFRGRIQHWPAVETGLNRAYPVTVAGELTIHGVSRPLEAAGTIEIRGDKVLAQATFIVAPADFAIKIPSIVRFNIAEEVDVHVDIMYEAHPANQ